MIPQHPLEWLTVNDLLRAGACAGGVHRWRAEFAPTATAVPTAAALPNLRYGYADLVWLEAAAGLSSEVEEYHAAGCGGGYGDAAGLDTNGDGGGSMRLQAPSGVHADGHGCAIGSLHDGTGYGDGRGGPAHYGGGDGTGDGTGTISAGESNHSGGGGYGDGRSYRGIDD